MNCSNIGTGISECIPNFESKIENYIFSFKGNTRKAMKLLIKQFTIISIQSHPDEVNGTGERITVKPGKILIKYYLPQQPNEIFIWTIEENEINS